MAYNNTISRSGSGALIPEEVSNDMLGKATQQSAVLQMFKHIPVQGAQVRFPILSALPVAYWVSGDTGLKQTTEIDWTNKFMNIEEIATIMPMPDNVVDDVDANIWDEAAPLITEAMGRLLDSTVFFGANAPSSFPMNINAAVNAAGNNTAEGSAASAGGYFGDIDALYSKVEADGYEPNGWVSAVSAKAKLRSARDSQGRKLDVGRTDGAITTLDGFPINFGVRGLWPTASGSPRLFGGDWSQFLVGIRKDITIKVLDQAVIQDNTGAIVYNLAQQDMTAVRVTFRVGWQVANSINNDNPTDSTRYPVGSLTTP